MALQERQVHLEMMELKDHQDRQGLEEDLAQVELQVHQDPQAPLEI